MAEISDRELAEYQAGMKLLKTLEQKGGTKFFKAVKEILPDLRIPEVDIPQPVEAELKKLADRFDGFDKHLRDAGAEADKIAQRNRLKTDGWTPEGIAKVEELMTKEKIGSWDAATALFEKQNPKPAPAREPGHRSGRWNWGKLDDKNESDKLLLADPEAWADEETAKVLNEFDAERERE